MPTTVLITGPPGSGKSTVVECVKSQLCERGVGKVLHLRGDAFSHIVSPWEAFDEELDLKYRCLSSTFSVVSSSREFLFIDDVFRRRRDWKLLCSLCLGRAGRSFIYRLLASEDTCLERNALRSPPHRAKDAYISRLYRICNSLQYHEAIELSTEPKSATIASRIVDDIKPKCAPPIHTEVGSTKSYPDRPIPKPTIITNVR